MSPAQPAAGAPPARRRCSTIQIEMNRGLYLDEAKVERADGFDKLKRSLESLMAVLRSAVQRAA